MRKPMVTRSIKGTKVTVMCVDTTDAHTFEKEYIVKNKYSSDEKLMNYIRKTYDTDTVKNITVTGKEEVVKLYGLPEEEFVAMAKELDPETRRAVNE